MAGLTKFNKVREKPLVLLSPLDWGLGHATRCIPLIRELILLNCDVIIACSPTQRKLLEIEFQSLTFFDSPSAPPVYGRNRILTITRLLFQVPKILTLVKRENQWLNAFLKAHPVDAIISDNRFGFYATAIPCIFITHQLGVKTGLGMAFDALARNINYRYIDKFSECWVPDYEEPDSLAGGLANPSVQPKITLKHIGALSRFETCDNTHRYELLIILSGPEPQRSLLENKITGDLKSYTGKAILVRGLPGEKQLPTVPANVQVYNHVPAAQLNEMICSASFVISRCGYTTVMDLMKLQKKSILIPTPGQAEQEYLAKHLFSRQLAYTVTQNKFSLDTALKAAAAFSYKKMQAGMEAFKPHLRQFVAKLNGNHQPEKTTG